ncbi:BTAD domain-containing putative transcriptional regulator [Saccharothrix variisporea]|uniref:Putative ATPase n=1 Tax=Saccharothrix variisporea TaxID=543527 RepID=A0A495X7S8_9PSEU|nr:BTAD domain-containing putative transcriptional regulator [Saccharothrix variisporea]RKT69215.1 putative ATPase [Saccharothrix variisporea]
MHGNETRLRVTLLGTFEVCRGDAVVAVPGARLRSLVARLALAGGRPVEPGVLVGALWPGELPADPVNALQSLVSRLRRVLGGAGAVTQSEGGYRLDVTEDDVDVLRFERLAALGRARLRAGDPPAAAELLGEAVALCGDPSVIAAVAPAVATRLARTAVEAGAGLAEAELALGRADDAAGRLSALLAEHPADERVAALQMDALAAQGRQAEALDVYERVREALADRLGADPGAALRERHLRLLQSPAPAPEAPASTLPAALTSFIGRDDDLARIDALLTRGRLVTVVGPGGAGKTRLAVEAGRRYRHEYRDGTWLVDLAAVTEPAKAGSAVLAAIGLRGTALFEASGWMRAGGSELDMLTDRLNGRECLLVVDNCEHLVDAVAHLIAALLPRCAGLRVLATSREPLAIDGEALVPLGPLALPAPDDDLEDVRRSASVRLLTERAAAVRPGFDVDERTRADVVRLVRGLDGMPLALELAAARMRTLSPAELAAGLSDRFRLLATGRRAASPRHRTLRGVIAWSWDLLDEDERTVAERVAVLPGGVTSESAAAVCAGTAVLPDEVPELLSALIDKSLLHLAPDAGRYRMLETLREYGIERLAERGVLDAVRDLAARYLATLVAREEPLLRGPDQLAALRVISTEYDNALAALRHLCDTGDATAAVGLARDLSWYWQVLGRHADAAYWQGEALALPAEGPALDRDSAEAMLLLNRINARSPLAIEGLDENESALRAVADRLLAHPSLPGVTAVLAAITLHFLREHEASLALVDRLVDGPDVWLSGLAHLFRASFAENEGDLDQVRVDVAAALDAFGRTGDRWGMASALPMRAMLRQYDGDLDGALADLREARAQAREFGSPSLADEIFLDVRWIELHLRRGEDASARAMLDAVRERAERSASPELVVIVTALEAGTWLRLGDLDRAQARIEVAEAGVAGESSVGGDHARAIVGSVRASLSVRRGDAEGAEVALARAYATALASRDLPIMALVAVAGAELAELRGRHRDVALLLGAASRLRGTHDRSDPRIQAMVTRGRTVLGEDVFAAAYQGGWHLDGKTASLQVAPART